MIVLFGGGGFSAGAGVDGPAESVRASGRFRSARAGGGGAAPAADAVQGRGRPTGPTWQQQLLAKGWGYANLNTGSVQADCGAGLTSGIIGLVNKGQPRALDDWGALSAWGWGASRLLDYFETDKSIDARRVGVQGHSRSGKAALVAMAFDERFAIGYISSSGQGGAKLNRRKYGEMIENVANSFYHWMAGNYLKYTGALGHDAGRFARAHRALRAAARIPECRQQPRSRSIPTEQCRSTTPGSTPKAASSPLSARARSTGCSARKTSARPSSRRSTRRSSRAISGSASTLPAIRPNQRGRRSSSSPSAISRAEGNGRGAEARRSEKGRHEALCPAPMLALLIGTHPVHS